MRYLEYTYYLLSLEMVDAKCSMEGATWAPCRTQDQAVGVVGEHQRCCDQQAHDKESVAKSEPETGSRLQVTPGEALWPFKKAGHVKYP